MLAVALVALFAITVFISLTTDYCMINCQQPTPATSPSTAGRTVLELQKVQDEHGVVMCAGAVEITATTPAPNATNSGADMNTTSHLRKNSAEFYGYKSYSIKSQHYRSLRYIKATRNTPHSRRKNSTAANPTASRASTTSLRYINATRNTVHSSKTSPRHHFRQLVALRISTRQENLHKAI